MSYQLLKNDVLFYQRMLKSIGLYTGILDGKWGKKTTKADEAFLKIGQEIAQREGTFDPTSESNIFTLIPKAQVAVRKYLQATINAGYTVKVISGTRTYAEQNALYRIGRYGSDEPRVTNAKGGQSNHNFGLAWDISIFEYGEYIDDENSYIELASIIMPQFTKIEWGGNWKSFKDVPHYQIKPLDNLVAKTRAKFEKGIEYA